LKRHGKKKWRSHVADVVAHFIAALRPDDIVIGGGNVKKLGALPSHCRAGDNTNAFRGGFRLWERDAALPPRGLAGDRSSKATAAGALSVPKGEPVSRGRNYC
jgi:polyphosphate glucokinase